MSSEEFNHLSKNVVPVIVDARPFGKYSMVDIDTKGGVQVIVKNLLEAGLLNGDTITCTGETLSEQIKRLSPPNPDNEVIYSVSSPYKPTGGLRVLGGNLSPEYSSILKLAGVEGGLENNVFKGQAKIFDGEQALLDTLDKRPEVFENFDMIVVRYEGPVGGPGMPEMLDSTSRITTLCREKSIVVALMTDGRFSGGSVGLVIGHVGPEAAVGGPIALIEEGDQIILVDGKKLDIALDINKLLLIRGVKKVEVERANGRQEIIQIPEDIGNRMFESGELSILYPRSAAIVDSILTDRPAYQAGIKSGDKIISANGVKIDDWKDLSNFNSENANQIAVSYTHLTLPTICSV